MITLEEPIKPMLLEASTAGAYTSPISGKDYPRIPILTIRQLLGEQAEWIPAKQATEPEGTVRIVNAPMS